MNTNLAEHPRLERLLATVLHVGTWISSGVIALGLLLPLAGRLAEASFIPSGPHVVTAGIAVLILLPVLRVAVMLGMFVRDRDYPFVAISALVLLIICLGFALGLAL